MIYRIVGMNLSGGARRYCYILNSGLHNNKKLVKTFIPKSPIDDEYSDSDKVPFDYVNTNDWKYVAVEIIKNRKNINYVHLHLANVCVRFYFLLLILRIPYIVTVHAPIYRNISLKERIYHFIYSRSIIRATRTIFISDFVRGNVLSALKIKGKINNSTVIFNGSEDPFNSKNFDYVSYLSSRINKDLLRICIVGELTERKGLMDLENIIIRIVENCEFRDKKIILNLYGLGPLSAYIKDLSKKYNNKNLQIILNGYQSNLNCIYQYNDIHMILSKDEAFGRVVSESMAYAIPTVCYAKGAFPELISTYSDGVLAESENEIADAIIMLYADEKKLFELSSNARIKFLEKFESSIFTINTMNAISEALR